MRQNMRSSDGLRH